MGDRWSICQHSTKKWHDGANARCPSVACVGMLCPSSRVGLQECSYHHIFKNIEEMLLRLYFLYKKSPKKTQELREVVEDLKEVFELPKDGNKPVQSQDSRWINHKCKAFQHVIDQYGAYFSYLKSSKSKSKIIFRSSQGLYAPSPG